MQIKPTYLEVHFSYYIDIITYIHNMHILIILLTYILYSIYMDTYIHTYIYTYIGKAKTDIGLFEYRAIHAYMRLDQTHM